MRDVYNTSNFNNQAVELYNDLILFGTACMFVGGDSTDIVRFRTFPLNEIFIREDFSGRVDTVVRKFEWQIRKIIKRFGIENISEKMRQRVENNNNATTTVVHIVFPTDDVGLGEWKTKKKLASVYFDYDSKMVIDEGGFDSLPFLIPRWSVNPGEEYGRGPGMVALPDIKTLYKMMYTVLSTAEKMADPPLMIPEGITNDELDLSPRALNYIRQRPNSKIEPIYPGTALPYAVQLVDRKVSQIRQVFFNDQLQLLDQKVMTAFEVGIKNEEKMRLLSPVLGRLHSEYLRPLISRTFAIMEAAGAIPPAPVELQDEPIGVEYLSPIARAQKSGDVRAITRLFEVVAPFAQVDPAVLEAIDGEELTRYVSDILGVPHKVMRSEEELEERREQEQAAAAAQLRLQQAEQFTGALDNAAAAEEKLANAQRTGEAL
jgi:hypothetical protein